MFISWGKIILTDQINGSSYKDGSILFRDRLISKTGEFCCLGASSLMKETDRNRQREEEEGDKGRGSFIYNSVTTSPGTSLSLFHLCYIVSKGTKYNIKHMIYANFDVI